MLLARGWRKVRFSPSKVRPRAAEARQRADEAERKATAANERFDRFRQKRIAEAQEAAARASEAARIANLEAEAQRPLWQRIFRWRGGRKAVVHAAGGCAPASWVSPADAGQVSPPGRRFLPV